MNDNLFIPENNFGIDEGYYSTNQIVDFLRWNSNNPDAICFIADMMEV